MLRSSGDTRDGENAAKLRLVYSISRLLSAAVDEHSLVLHACELLAGRWPYRYVAFVEALDDGSARVVASAGNLRDVIRERAEHHPMRWDGAGVSPTSLGTALRTGVTTTLRSEELGPQALRDDLTSYGVTASAAMPVWNGAQRSALLVLSDLEGGFTQLELELLQGLAEDLTYTLEGLRLKNELFEERKRARTRLERLEALWDLAARELDADSHVDAIVREGEVRLGLESGALARLVGNSIVFEATTSDNDFHSTGEVLPAGDTFAGRTIAAKRTLHSANLASESMYRDLKTPVERGAAGVIASPFSAGGDQYALVFVGSQPHAEFDIEDVAYVELLAAFCARVLQHREDVQRISFLQNNDPLTQLPNRLSFATRLRDALERASRSGAQFAVVLVDLVGLRDIHDEFGSVTGDRVLEELTSRLAMTAGAEDLLFRTGSEAFGLLHTRWISVTHIDELAHALITSLERPIVLGDSSFAIAAFVGLAIYPDDGGSADDLEIAAEAALRRAKREIRSGHRFYSSELDAHLAHRRMAALELRRAIEAHQLILHYQPIISVAERAPIALEALVRWPHPDRGILMPAHFIPLAEESDLILHLGTFVIQEAAREARAFTERGVHIPIAVNISAAQFAEPTFVHGVRRALSSAGVAPALIELELTETVAMRDPQRTQALMQECRAMGLRIALDDFGTGHSSLAVLKRLPIDILKIDKAFISGLPEDLEDAAIARAVIALGKSLRCEVRAEGVETPAQADWLEREGCDSAQGYLFARPGPPESFAALVHEDPAVHE